jgi:hypothetical protein
MTYVNCSASADATRTMPSLEGLARLDAMIARLSEFRTDLNSGLLWQAFEATPVTSTALGAVYANIADQVSALTAIRRRFVIREVPPVAPTHIVERVTS